MVTDLSRLSSYNKFIGTGSENYQLKQDNKTVNFNSRIKAASQLLPQSRKLADFYNYLNTGCYIYAAGNGIRFINEFLPDCKDVRDVFSSKNHDPEWQKPIRLIEGTLIYNTKIGKKLQNFIRK